MRAVKSRDTNPELAVRRLLFSTGYRYRLHRADLPGKPDIAFPGLRKVIFVNGCFWHGHDCARGARVPKANRPYWEEKVGRNRERDKLQLRKLQELGWSALSVWECEIRNPVLLLERMQLFLNARPVRMS